MELAATSGASPGAAGFVEQLVKEARREISAEGDIRIREPFPMVAAASCIGLAAVLIAALLLWPRITMASLANVSMPWCDRYVPTLRCDVQPGNTSVAEGEANW